MTTFRSDVPMPAEVKELIELCYRFVTGDHEDLGFHEWLGKHGYRLVQSPPADSDGNKFVQAWSPTDDLIGVTIQLSPEQLAEYRAVYDDNNNEGS